MSATRSCYYTQLCLVPQLNPPSPGAHVEEKAREKAGLCPWKEANAIPI